MGPSGSGKSTLMHCMAALDSPTGGQVYLGETEARLAQGQAADHPAPRQDRLRVPELQPGADATARENIELPLSIAGRKPDPDWFDAVIDTVNLRDRLHHRPNELGGQQQRVARARALMSRPEIAFADEPTGNLDSTSGAEVLSLRRSWSTSTTRRS